MQLLQTEITVYKTRDRLFVSSIVSTVGVTSVLIPFV